VIQAYIRRSISPTMIGNPTNINGSVGIKRPAPDDTDAAPVESTVNNARPTKRQLVGKQPTPRTAPAAPKLTYVLFFCLFSTFWMQKLCLQVCVINSDIKAAVVLSAPVSMQRGPVNKQVQVTEVWIYTDKHVAKVKALGSGKLDALKVNGCYRFTGVSLEKTTYTVCTNTTIEDASGDERPAMSLDFVSLSDLRSGDKDKAIAGVVVSIGEPQSGVGRQSNKEYTRRDIFIADTSCTRIKLTMWNAMAHTFTADIGTVVMSNSANVEQYNGYLSLTPAFDACLLVNHNLPRCKALKQWYTAVEKDDNGVPNSLINAMELEELTLGEANRRAESGVKVRCTMVGKIQYINDEVLSYTSCGECSRSLRDNVCQEHGVDDGQGRLRYKLDVHFEEGEHTGVAIAFDDVGKEFFGMEAKELESLKDSDPGAFDNAFKELMDRDCRLYLTFTLYHGHDADSVQITIFRIEMY
jgi:hypothetical protein